MNKIKVLFMGRKSVAERSLLWLLDKDEIEVVGVLTDSHLDISPCTVVAKNYNIPTYDFNTALERINSGDLHFDLGLSMLYWRKLKGGFIHSPRLKTINFHPAPLPEYKGTAGYNMAILDALSQWGMTAHYVDDEIDTGEIIDILSFPICPETETAKSLERTSQDKLFQLFVKVVNEVLATNSVLQTTPNVGGKYISRADMEAMKEIQPGDDIARKIRAFWFPPYDGAFIKINGQKYTLVDQNILNSLSDTNVSKVY